MISIVCVYDNERTLKNVLLKILKNQSVEFELITLDNTNHRYKSAAEALNYGGAKANGDYIMFVHQDMWLGSDSWMEDVEKMLESIPDLGMFRFIKRAGSINNVHCFKCLASMTRLYVTIPLQT